MTSLHRLRWFIAGLCFQVILLAGMGIWKQSILWRGREIVLEARSTAMWDPIRGDYILLDYSVGRLSVSLLRDSDRLTKHDLKLGDTLFVQLEQDGRFWRAKHATSTKPDRNCFLKGRVENIEFDQAGKPSVLHMKYGIEAWLAAGSQLSRIESAQQSFNPYIEATVSVTPDGVAVLCRARVVASTAQYRNKTGVTPSPSPQ